MRDLLAREEAELYPFLDTLDEAAARTAVPRPFRRWMADAPKYRSASPPSRPKP